MTPHVFIETYTGRTFAPLAPVWTDIRIEDIAHGLANQGRFSGHTRHHYSVGQHSVLVSELLHKQGYRRPVQLWGLLHDASEAYLVDLPTPLKAHQAFGDIFRQAESRLMKAVCRYFSLPMKEPPAVTMADRVLLATEVRDQMHGDRPYWRKIQTKPMKERIRPWAEGVAEYEFLRRYHELSGTEGRR